MTQEDIMVFIDSATNYFDKMSTKTASIGVPYLKESNQAINHQFTGIIGISGKKKGFVYFSAPKTLLDELLISIGELSNSQEVLADLVGEVANTIAGNARAYFGSEFMISVPYVVDDTRKIKLPPTARCYVIPLEWNGQIASIIISLE